MTERNRDADPGRDEGPEPTEPRAGAEQHPGPAAAPEHADRKDGPAGPGDADDTVDRIDGGEEPEEPEKDAGPEEADGDGDGGNGRGDDGGDGDAPPRRRAELPEDEDAAWAEIVAAYGEEPDAGALAPEAGVEGREPDGDTLTASRPGGDDGGASPRSFTVYAAGTGPRNWTGPDPDDEEDEGHYEPPEPPPLPQADTTTKFAWIAVLGGPLLLIFTILFQQEMTWWIITLGIGGFLGGFGTLVARMRDGRDDEDGDDPGRGAVV